MGYKLGYGPQPIPGIAHPNAVPARSPTGDSISRPARPLPNAAQVALLGCVTVRAVGAGVNDPAKRALGSS